MFGCTGMSALWLLASSVFWLGIIALVIWAVVRLFPTRAQYANRAPSSFYDAEMDDPLDILERRFARGEISREEFEQARQALG
jgi:putative membrane protein